MLKKITICSLSAATLVFGTQIRLDTTLYQLADLKPN